MNTPWFEGYNTDKWCPRFVWQFLIPRVATFSLLLNSIRRGLQLFVTFSNDVKKNLLFPFFFVVRSSRILSILMNHNLVYHIYHKIYIVGYTIKTIKTIDAISILLILSILDQCMIFWFYVIVFKYLKYHHYIDSFSRLRWSITILYIISNIGNSHSSLLFSNYHIFY